MASNQQANSEATTPKKYWGKLAYLNYQKPVYNKTKTKTNPHQVAAYTARKNMKSAVKELSPPADILVDQILNPEDCNDIERWPNTYGLSSVYKCKTIFSAKFDANGRSCVSVSPTIKDCIFTTWGDESTVQLASYGSSTNAPYSFQNIVLDKVGMQVEWGAPIICNNGQALLPFPFAPQSKLLYPISFGMSIGTATTTRILLEIRFPNALTSQASVNASFYDSNMAYIAGTTTSISTQSTPDGIGISIPVGTNSNVSQLQSIAYMSITIQGRNLPYRGPVYLWFNQTSDGNGTSSLVLPNHAQHVGVYDIKDADTIKESASQAFVLSQSLLLTAEMSDINNGGMLSIARVPGNNPIGMDGISSGSSIVSSNWYEWLSSMPNNNYDGPVKDGGYGFYLAEDESGYFYRPVDNFFSSHLPYLAAEFTVSPDLTESAVVRIKVCTIVQFTTTASIYDQRPSCHLMEKELVHHILSLVPACYSNDGHVDGLKRNLKKVGSKVKYLLRNPKTYEVTAKALLTLASLI